MMYILKASKKTLLTCFEDAEWGEVGEAVLSMLYQRVFTLFS